MTQTHSSKRFIMLGLLAFAVFLAYTDRVNISVAAIEMQLQFGWSDTTKGLVLSAFFMGYLLTQVVGGWLSNRYGGRRVLGYAVIVWSALTFLTPAAAGLSLSMLIAARIGLGIGEAMVAPAAYNLLGRWIPVTERARSVAIMMTGGTLGAPIALALTGSMIGAFGWPMAFYSFAVVGFLWVAVWFWKVPEHPPSGAVVDLQESTAARSIPWRHILSQPAVWALCVNNFCVLWTVYVLLAWLPSYFSDVQGLDTRVSGLFSAAPWLTMAVMLNIAGWIADRLVRRGRSVTFVRKLMQTTGLLGNACCLLLVSQAETPILALLLTSGVMGFIGFCFSGYAANPLDLSPKYADVLVGISNTFGTLPGVFGVLVTGVIVDRTGSYIAAFLLAAGISVVGALVFLVLGSGKQVID